MPKSKPKLAIRLDLLKPQSNPEKLPVKLIRWLLSTGRYIFVLVEALVLIAFGARFKLDADLSAKKEAIEQQIPYIESLKPYEILIRQTQLKLATINTLKTNSADYPVILKKIADQTPLGVKLIGMNLDKSIDKVTIKINAQAQNNNDLTNFVAGLKSDQTFSDVNLAGVGLEQGSLHFSISTFAHLTSLGGKSL